MPDIQAGSYIDTVWGYAYVVNASPPGDIQDIDIHVGGEDMRLRIAGTVITYPDNYTIE